MGEAKRRALAAPSIHDKIERLTSEQEAQRQRWDYRAVSATRGHQTKMGCILLATLGKASNSPPKIIGSATINAEGWILANFINKDGDYEEQAVICTVDEFTENFSILADNLKFSDEDRIAMFKKAREWIKIDKRPHDNGMLHFKKG